MDIKYLRTHAVILLASFISFRYFIEQFLFPHVGMGWAYVTDQLVILLSSIALTYYIIFRNTPRKAILSAIRKHRTSLISLFIIAFIMHVGVLGYYFWSDEVIWLLKPITQNTPFFFQGNIFKGYFVLSYALTFLLAGPHYYWIYGLVSIVSFATTSCVIYLFLVALTEKRSIAWMGSLFVSVTPSFFDMFTWHSTGHAPVVAAVLLSGIFLIQYLKTHTPYWYYLSVIWYFTAVKIGFIRIAPFILILFLIIVWYLRKKSLKQSIADTLSRASSFIAVALYFCVFNFFYPELSNLYSIYQTSGIGGVMESGFHYRASAHSEMFLPKLSYFLTHLFVPSGLVHDIFKKISPVYVIDISYIELTGYIILGVLSCIALISLYNARKPGRSILFFFAAMIIVINLLHIAAGFEGSEFDPKNPYSPQKLDTRFTYEHMGYGPGSRYVYISSIGVGLLFALTIHALFAKRSPKVTLAATGLSIVVLAIHGYYLVRAQFYNVSTIEDYAYVARNILRDAPPDPHNPVVIFTPNPEKNSLDTKIGSWHWLIGFYKEENLYYTKDLDDLKRYMADHPNAHLYAFYTNPQTLTYTNITSQVAELLEHSPSPIPLIEPSLHASSKRTEATNLTLFEQAHATLSPHTRLVTSASATLVFTVTPLSDSKYPIILVEDAAMTIPHVITQKLSLSYTTYNSQNHSIQKPITTSLAPGKTIDALDSTSYQSLVSLLKKRDTLNNVSGIHNILTDHAYSLFPKPIETASYNLYDSLPATIEMNLGTKSTISGVELNTPHIYDTSAVPTEVIVQIKNRNTFFTIPIETLVSGTSQSPNKGVLTTITFAPTLATAVQVTVVNTNGRIPPVFDEISLISPETSAYSPLAWDELIKSIPSRIESPALLHDMTTMSHFNRAYGIYACGEDSDWIVQEKSRSTPVPNIWHTAIVSFEPGKKTETTFPVNCNGSILREVHILGPTYPSEFTLERLTLN